MIVLHAGIESGRFLLWGEEAQEDAPGPVKRRRQPRSRSQSAPTLPYDAGESGLDDALQAISAGVIRPHKAEAVTVWLPTVAGLPMASSSLIAERLETGTGVRLLPWQITALHLDTIAAANLLCACINQQMLAPGIIIGRDLAFWAQALRFAGALVAKQQFLPGVQVIEGAYVARWQPIFAGADAQRRKTLVKAMPQVGRALSHRADAPPITPASSVLDHLLEVIVDY